MRRAAIATVVPLILLGTGFVGCSRDLDERIAVEDEDLLELAIDLGQGLRPDPGGVEIVSHSAQEVRVQADVSGWGAWGWRSTVEREGRRVRVDGRVRGVATWLFGGPRVEMRVRIPRNFHVDAHANGGWIRLTDLGGSVRARTDDAPIELRGAEGFVKLRTSGDSVSVEEVEGDVEIKVRDGSIDLAWIEGNADLRTSNGAIGARQVAGRVLARSGRGRIELHDIGGPVDLKTERGAVFTSFTGDPAGSIETERGGVEVVFPEGRGAKIDARSARGSVELGPELDLPTSEDGSRASGQINGGGPPLRLRTARGNVQVRSR